MPVNCEPSPINLVALISPTKFKLLSLIVKSNPGILNELIELFPNVI